MNQVEQIPDPARGQLPDFERERAMIEAAYKAVHGEGASPSQLDRDTLERARRRLLEVTGRLEQFMERHKDAGGEFINRAFQAVMSFSNLKGVYCGELAEEPPPSAAAKPKGKVRSKKKVATPSQEEPEASQAAVDLTFVNHHPLTRLKKVEPKLYRAVCKALGRGDLHDELENTALFDRCYAHWVRRDSKVGELGTYLLFRTADVDQPMIIRLDLAKSHNRNHHHSQEVDSFYSTRLTVGSFLNRREIFLGATLSSDSGDYNTMTEHGYLFGNSAVYGFMPSHIGGQVLKAAPALNGPGNGKVWTPFYMSLLLARGHFLRPFKAYAKGEDGQFSAEADLNQFVDSGDLQKLMQRFSTENELGCVRKIPR